MLDHLQRSGHIRSYASCADACGGCGLKGECGGSAGGVRLWQG